MTMAEDGRLGGLAGATMRLERHGSSALGPGSLRHAQSFKDAPSGEEASSRSAQEAAAGQRGRRPATADSAGPKLVHGDYTFTTARKSMQISSRTLSSDALPSEEALSSGVMPAMRPMSGSSVNMAAWKAYGSPSARGMPKPPPSPAAAHPNANATGSLLGFAPSKPPRAQSLGGGFRLERPSSAPAHNPYHPQQPPSPHAPQQPGSSYAHHGYGKPTHPSSPKTPAAALLAQLKRPSSRPSSAAAGAGPGTAATPGRNKETQVASTTPEGDLRFAQTLPTDPYGKFLWETQSRQAMANAARAVAKQRPGGSGRPTPTSGAASRQRFKTMKLALIQQLGPGGYQPPIVTGFAAPEPTQDLALPAPGDPRWTYTRLGATQIQKLQQSLKMPDPLRARPTTAPAFTLGRRGGGGGDSDDDGGRGGSGAEGSPKAKKPLKEKPMKESIALALRRGPRFAADDDEDDDDGGPSAPPPKPKAVVRRAGFGIADGGSEGDDDDNDGAAPVAFALGAGRRKKKGPAFAGVGGSEDGSDGGSGAAQQQQRRGSSGGGGSGAGGRSSRPASGAAAARGGDDDAEGGAVAAPVVVRGGSAAHDSKRHAKVDLRMYLEEDEQGDDGNEDDVAEMLPVHDEPAAASDDDEQQGGDADADDGGGGGGDGAAYPVAADQLAAALEAAIGQPPGDEAVAHRASDGASSSSTSGGGGEGLLHTGSDRGGRASGGAVASARGDDGLAGLHGAASRSHSVRHRYAEPDAEDSSAGDGGDGGGAAARGFEDEEGIGVAEDDGEGGEAYFGGDGGGAGAYEEAAAGSSDQQPPYDERLVRSTSLHRPTSARPVSGRPTSAARPTSARPMSGARGSRVEYNRQLSSGLHDIHESEAAVEGEEGEGVGARALGEEEDGY